MDVLAWALIGVLSIAELALLLVGRKSVAAEHRPRVPPPKSPERVATRSRRLWLDYKPPSA
jgi:hypothetical protein